MTAVDYLMSARASLDALAELIADAAENEKPVSEIADEALAIQFDIPIPLQGLEAQCSTPGSTSGRAAASREPRRQYLAPV